MTAFDDYRGRYRYVDLTREDGILQIRIHRDQAGAAWSSGVGGIHDELGDAFIQVARDPDNRVVILTGTGDHFLVGRDEREPLEDFASTAFWSRIEREGRDLIDNLLLIPVPVIGALNGPAWVHAELVAMSDIVIASERASIADKGHMPNGITPGDGVHVWGPMVLGPNRARHFLLTGDEIDAAEAKRLGVVAEVVAHDAVRARAWEVARSLAAKPALALRYARLLFTRPIKRAMADDLGYGLALESMAALDMAAAMGTRRED
jgi:enoyl-CoA hydratase/carnithine racemase